MAGKWGSSLGPWAVILSIDNFFFVFCLSEFLCPLSMFLVVRGSLVTLISILINTDFQSSLFSWILFVSL